MDKVQKLSNPECNAPPSGRVELVSAVIGAIDLPPSAVSVVAGLIAVFVILHETRSSGKN
jgi:hypothetical protein